MKNPLVRRLAPLFIAKFLLCFVFWYSIEKLFMYSIGFNDASIGLMAAIYAVMSVLMEVPSGVLADRWSRKGVMILSALSMLLSSYFGWISNETHHCMSCRQHSGDSLTLLLVVLARL